MSWNAHLNCSSCGQDITDANYTHNTNPMIRLALKLSTGEQVPDCGGPLGKAIGPAWWDKLNGMSGAEGAAYLDDIIKGLESDPEQFRPLNPENGWGSYKGLLEELTRMRDAVPEYPTVWSTSG